MSDILGRTTPQSDADHEASIHRLLEDMTQIEAQMDRDRADSDQLKSELQAIKAKSEAKLVHLEELTRCMVSAV